MRITTTSLCIASLMLASCGSNAPAVASNSQEAKGGKTGTISTPLLDQDDAATTPTSVGVLVTAGATGLPAGFSLQWMTLDDFEANNGSWADDASLCKGSFSGNANESRYDLAAGESVTVLLGDLVLDNGASTNCYEALTCGTQYVVRAFGHATSTLFRSEFSTDLAAATEDCTVTSGCTLTQGYWKTHGPVPAGGNDNEWPKSTLTLGTVTYTDLELQNILDAPVKGNGLVSLAHQLIAAKLNVANGAADAAAAGAIADADALIGGLVVPPVGSGALASSATSDLVTQLTAYNEGAIGPGHCE